MRRREFITLVGGAAVAWPVAAQGQQGDRMRRIGVLSNLAEDDPEASAQVEAFSQRLRELGWIDGRNIRIDSRRSSGDRDRLLRNAAELADLKPDLILCTGTPAVAATQQTTRIVPIVFVNAQNPVESGFVASLARPGGNITGFIAFEPPMGGKWLETLKEIAPSIARVGLIFNPLTHSGRYFQSIEIASRSLSVKPIRLPFLDAAEIKQTLDDFRREPDSGVVVMPDINTTFHRNLITGLMARHRMPAVYPFRHFITSGGLAYYGATANLYRQAAEYADRILRGAKPSELPVQAPTKFELVINLRAAKAIGLDVSPTMLARADEVIE